MFKIDLKSLLINAICLNLFVADYIFSDFRNPLYATDHSGTSQNTITHHYPRNARITSHILISDSAIVYTPGGRVVNRFRSKAWLRAGVN